MNDLSLRYREQQVYSASPIQRLLMVYDVAIVSCNTRDLARTTQALNLLRSSLDFERGGELAMRLMSLYIYCADRARAGDFDESARVLRGLVQAWVEVLVKRADATARRTQAAPTLSLAG